MHKLWRAFALMMAVMLAVFMVGCGDDDDDDDDDTGTVAPTFVSANPAAGSTIPANASITLTFSGPATGVTVNGTPATSAGNTATWTGTLTPGAATLNVAWTGGAGTTLNYTVTAPDTTAPTIASGSVGDGDQDVDPEPLNADGIEIKFSEAVARGRATLSVEGGEDLQWTAAWPDATTLKLEKLVTGKDLGNETTYVLDITGVKDLAGNDLAGGKITFVTKAKDQ